MLNLIKYEFRKNRTVLLVISGGLLLLQLYYMFNAFTFKGNEDKLAFSAAFLILYSVICFFAVFILAVANYSRELNSKSSYLIFMTPNSSYTIIFSKMLSTLFLGIAIAAVFVLLCILDMNLYHMAVPEANDFATAIRHMLESMGIPVGEILLNALSGILTFLVDFFAVVSIVYLSVTLSATFLQNSKLKGILSVALFLLLTYVLSRITDLLPLLYDPPRNTTEALLSVLPATIFNLAVLVVCIFVSGRLLEKRVSL